MAVGEKQSLGALTTTRSFLVTSVACPFVGGFFLGTCRRVAVPGMKRTVGNKLMREKKKVAASG
jgi:hypothetical protein